MNDVGQSWTGYLRSDGRKGIRNLVLVMYTVECAKHVAHAIAADEGDDIQVLGFPGCYDNQYAVRLMLALGRHPNVGAVLAVGLGCEYTRPDRIAEVVAASGRPAEWFTIQNEGGTRSSVEKGKGIVRRMREQLSEVPRVPMTLADLTVGAECGGSDGTSGLAGNPVVGAFFDRLVDAGGSAIFEETVEMIGLRNIMLQRAANEEARRALAAAHDKAVQYCQRVRQFSVAPGNFAGGLSTIEEKSMGAFAKGGSRPIQGVIRVTEPPRHPGLWIMDTVPDPHFMGFGYTNPNDTEGIMDLVSGGAQIVLFITGRGSVIGSVVAPLIKVTGNVQTYARMEEDMDFNAGRVLTGETTLEQAGAELCDRVIRVAAGERSKPEALGHREYFVMYKHQDTPPLTLGCRA